MDKKFQCIAKVLKRDQYRVDRRRGSGRFSMHYTSEQCSRAATIGEFCTQHGKMEYPPSICRWAERKPS